MSYAKRMGFVLAVSLLALFIADWLDLRAALMGALLGHVAMNLCLHIWPLESDE